MAAGEKLQEVIFKQMEWCFVLACDSLICQCFSLDNITTDETANTCSSLYHDNKLYLVTKYPETFMWLWGGTTVTVLYATQKYYIAVFIWQKSSPLPDLCRYHTMHGYKKYTITSVVRKESKVPCLFDGSSRLKKNESHIWVPRGGVVIRSYLLWPGFHAIFFPKMDVSLRTLSASRAKTTSSWDREANWLSSSVRW